MNPGSTAESAPVHRVCDIDLRKRPGQDYGSRSLIHSRRLGTTSDLKLLYARVAQVRERIYSEPPSADAWSRSSPGPHWECGSRLGFSEAGPLPVSLARDARYPYSEAQFKTVKYSEDYPDHTSLAQARTWCDGFFAYYNHEHRHSGIALHTPASAHFGTADLVREQRAVILAGSYARHPERFGSRPRPPALPGKV